MVPEDFDLLDLISKDVDLFDIQKHAEALTRVSKSLLGVPVAIQDAESVLVLRQLLRETNLVTGRVTLEIEDADTTRDVTRLLMHFLARCGSAVHRGHILASATARLQKLENPS